MPVQTKEMMAARMPNPVTLLPGLMQSLLGVHKAVEKSGVPSNTITLAILRASQINGCSVCVDMHTRELRQAGETDERLFTVAAWRDAPYFTEAERAALALSEAVTRMADRPDPVPDEVWQQAARHYDETALAGIVTAVAAVNVWNRLNVATRQVSGEWVKSAGQAQSH